MSYCDGCQFHQWETFEWNGEVVRQMGCVAGPNDPCLASLARAEFESGRDEKVKPCPTCGRDIDGYDDCPRCLEIECLGEIPPDADWGSGEYSPDWELRKAALSQGRP